MEESRRREALARRGVSVSAAWPGHLPWRSLATRGDGHLKLGDRAEAAAGGEASWWFCGLCDSCSVHGPPLLLRAAEKPQTCRGVDEKGRELAGCLEGGA